MPTLFRLLSVMLITATIVFGGLFVFAKFFEPEPREVTKSVHGVKIRRE